MGGKAVPGERRLNRGERSSDTAFFAGHQLDKINMIQSSVLYGFEYGPALIHAVHGEGFVFSGGHHGKGLASGASPGNFGGENRFFGEDRLCCCAGFSGRIRFTRCLLIPVRFSSEAPGVHPSWQHGIDSTGCRLSARRFLLSCPCRGK